MKIISKSILILFMFIMASSCVKEELIKTDPSFILSFQRSGQTNAMAGTKFYVIPTGSGEFFTLFDGTSGRVWGEEGAKGADFNQADSLIVQYSTAGKYNLTLVTSSSGNFGKEFSRSVKTVEVNVIDVRNSINIFIVNGVEGTITPENEILFSVPDVTTDYNFAPSFGFDSKDAKAFVNGVEQVSAKTANDFSQPVIYVVKSGNGDEKQYTVKFTTFPSSDEKAITKFAFGSGANGEVAVVDEGTKTINLLANYATNLAAVRLVLTSSYGSTIYLNDVAYSDRKNYNLSSTGIKQIKVVAQNKTEVVYKLNIVSEEAVTSFTFDGLVPAPKGVIDVAAKTVTINVLEGVDVTKLVAIWTGALGKVTVSGAVQTSGITVNDFSSTLTYTFYNGTTPGDRYKVTVNVK
jgi:hypothetical protein